jgi:hypothetical protein
MLNILRRSFAIVGLIALNLRIYMVMIIEKSPEVSPVPEQLKLVLGICILLNVLSTYSILIGMLTDQGSSLGTFVLFAITLLVARMAVYSYTGEIFPPTSFTNFSEALYTLNMTLIPLFGVFDLVFYGPSKN